MAVIPPAPNFVSDTKLDIGSDAKSSTISGESGLGRSVGMGRDWGCAVGVRTEGDTDAEADSYQIAYTMGGATFSVAEVDVDNAGYSAGSKEATVLQLGLAF